MLLGYSFKELLNTLKDKKINFLYLMLLISLLLFAFGITREDKIYLVLMCAGDYGNKIFFLLNAISGSAFILTLSTIIENVSDKYGDNIIKKFTLWVGQNTIGIFLLHKPFLRDVVVMLLNKIGLYESSFFVALLSAIITMPIICFCVYIINKYIPELFGKFNKKI